MEDSAKLKSEYVSVFHELEHRLSNHAGPQQEVHDALSIVRSIRLQLEQAETSEAVASSGLSGSLERIKKIISSPEINLGHVQETIEIFQQSAGGMFEFGVGTRGTGGGQPRAAATGPGQGFEPDSFGPGPHGGGGGEP